MDSAHRNSLQPGHLVHWYKIERILGQGGFGITYLAIDTNLNQQVAIKEYLPVELAVRDSNNSLYPISNDRSDQYSLGLSRFIEEAQILAKFDHHNIVRVVTVFEANNTAYMVMRYEEGESLQNILKARKTLNEKTLKNILFPILDGLEKVHAEGFIHRDIKPANIYIRTNGSPVLLDFGAARQSLGEATKTLTSMFSSGYAPFEQYFSKSDQQGPWTDIYGLGATMYRGITSKIPMDAVDRSNAILQLSRDTFVYAAEIGQEDYSEAFLKAVDSALQFKYQERPQSIVDWKSEFKLQKFIAKKKPTIKAKQEDISTKEATQANNTPKTKPKSGLSKSMIATVASIILIIFVSSYFLYGESGFNLKNEDKLLPEKKVLTAQEEIELRRQELKLLEEKAEQERLKAEALAKFEEEKKRKAAEEEADKQFQIKNLLTEAGESIRDKRLIEPTNNNALATYKKVLTLSPNNPDAMKGISNIAGAMAAEAKDLLNKSNFSTAQNIIAQALQVDPKSKEVIKVQAMLDSAITKKKQEDAKLEEAQRLAEEKDKMEEADKQLQIKTLLTEADRFMKEKRLTKPKDNNALANYRKIFEIVPDHPDAMKGFGNVAIALASEAKELISKRDFVEAQNIITQAIEIDPRSKELIQAKTLLDSAIVEEKEAQRLAEEKKGNEKVNTLIVEISKAVEDQEYDLAKKLLAEANFLDSESINLKSANKNYETQYSNWKQEQKRIEQVKQLLVSAKINLDKKRLSTPKGNNALEHYNQVLKLEPDNETAKEGVQIIFNQYIVLAQESIKADSYEKGKDYLDIAQKIIPDSQEVITIYDELTLKLAEIEKIKKEEEVEAKKLAEEKRLAEQKKLEEEAKSKRLAEEKNLAEAKAAKEMVDKRLAEEAAAKQAKNSKAGEFVKIPGGTYAISGNSVTIEPFEMGKYEITQGQWKAVMGNNPSQDKTCGDKCAVENVKWDDVQVFIKKLNSESSIKYRLPTAAEWEYACALEKGKAQCNGSNIHALFFGIGMRQGKNQPVGDKQPGVSNLTNNIWEWTCSVYSKKPSTSDSVCESTDKYATHAVRGGSKVPMETNFSTVVTTWNHYALRYPNIGFRLVVSK